MFRDSRSKSPELSNPPGEPRRRWFRISLRAMMVIVLLAGVSLSWPIRRANVQRRAVAALRKAENNILLQYDFQYSADGRFKPNASPWAPAWLRRVTGDEPFQEVDSVALFGPVTEIAWARLEEFERLRVLHIRDSSNIGDGLVHLRGMKGLEDLALRGPDITDAKLANIRGLGKLRQITLVDTRVTDAGLAHLATLSELESIRLVGKEGTAAGLTSRGITHVTDAGLAHLAGLHHLKLLEISAAPGVTDLGPLNPRSNLPALTSLNLHDTGVTDTGLTPIEGTAWLKYLDIRSTRITDDGLARLRGLSNAVSLDLQLNASVSDEGLAHLERLTNLNVLGLDHTKVSDGGLAHLKGLTALRRLSLGDTQVGDAGLVHLKGLTRLEFLYLKNTRVTDSGLQQLQKSLPKLTIRR
jgi:Leucine-rich repeat (LRR) protein